jgi:predicted nucleic acid-binding protein
MSEADSFFDTNVLLYLLSDTPKADRAEVLLASGGVVSAQVLNEFASVASRKLAMTIPEIREILSTIRAVCIVKPLDIDTHELGLDMAERCGFSIYGPNRRCSNACWMFHSLYGRSAAGAGN